MPLHVDSLKTLERMELFSPVGWSWLILSGLRNNDRRGCRVQGPNRKGAHAIGRCAGTTRLRGKLWRERSARVRRSPPAQGKALIRRQRRLANAQPANFSPCGITSPTVSMSQYAAMCRIRRNCLARGERHAMRSEASRLVCSLIRFSAWPRVWTAIYSEDPASSNAIATG